MESIYGVNCIKGEVHSLMTILRWSSRWGLKGSISNSSGGGEQNNIVTEFSELSDSIKGVYDLGGLNCCTYLQPFCSVVISKSANGPLTSASLNSLSKFALYGFFSSDFPGAKEGINMVAHAISSCIFEESDRESDEIILMKLLELATMTFRSDASDLLTVSAAWNMYETCLSIFGQIRSSKVLRSEAESTLRHLTLTMFCRIHAAVRGSSASNLDKEVNLSLVASAVKKSYWDTDKDNYSVADPVGMVMFLVKILTTLTTYLDSKAQSVEHVQLALSLVNVALEAGGTYLGQLPPIVEILRGDICRYLLVATQSDDLIVFNLSLRVVFNLFVSIKDHMKVQLEVFLNSVHIRLLQQSKVQQHQSIAKNMPNSALPGMSSYSTSDKVLSLWNAREEMILESLLEFANEPLVLQDLYVNYDCDVKCTNLYDTIISVLCTKSLPYKLQQLQLLDKIIDEDDYLDDLTTANTKPRAAKCATNSNTPSASFPKVLAAINANKSITDEVAYSGNNNVWYHALDGINKLAIDGLLTILRSLAGKCHVRKSNLQSSADPSGGLSAAGSRDQSPFVSTVNLERGSSQGSISGRSSTDILPLPLSMHVQFKSPLPTRSAPVSSIDAVDMWCMGSVDDEDDSLSGDAASESTSTTNSHRNSIGNIGMTGYGNALSPRMGAVPRGGDNADLLDGVEDAQFLLTAQTRTAEMLKERKLKKQRVSLIVEQFNKNPFSKDWVKLSITTNILPAAPVSIAEGQSPSTASSTNADPKALALFLKQNPGLDKTRVGEYLSKGPAEKYPYHAAVLKEYVNTFDFVGASFDGALRTFLGYFRLPGEAQCIDRLMEAFSQKLFHDLGQNNPFATGDAAFILSFSTIMLNTDLHNPNLPDAKRMTKDQFIGNNRGINDGESLPREYLENLYDCIKETQIKLDVDIAEVSGALDMNSWNNLISKNAALQAPPVFTPAVTARRSATTSMGVADPDDNIWSLMNIYQKDMFLVLAKPVLNCLLVVLERCYLDDVYIVRIIEGLLDFSTLCESLQLESLLDRLLIALYSSIKRIMEHRELKEKRDKAQFGVTSFAVDDLLSDKEFSTLKSLLEHDIPHIVEVSNDTRSASAMQNYTTNNIKKPSPRKAVNSTGTPARAGSDSNVVAAGNSPRVSSDRLSRNAEEMSSEQQQIQQMLMKSNKEKLRYIGSVQIRSEIILKLLLHCGQKYASSFTHNGWQVIFAALLWLRGKGLLGESARLSQVYQLGYAFNDSASKAAGKAGDSHAHSIDDYHNYYYSNSNNCTDFEQACHKAAMGLKVRNMLGGFENDEEAAAASKVSGGQPSKPGVLGNIWSMLAGQGTDETAAGGGQDHHSSNTMYADEVDMDKYISHFSWNSSVLYCARNVDSIRNAYKPRMWDSYCFLKHTMQYHDIIELSYEQDKGDGGENPSPMLGGSGGMGLAGLVSSASASSLLSNGKSTNSDIVLLKTRDIGVSNSLFVCLMYLIRSFVVELTEYQYNASNDGVSQGAENKIDRSVSEDSDASGATSLGLGSAPSSSGGDAPKKKPTKQAICSKQLDVCFLLDLGFRVMVSNIYGHAGKGQFDSGAARERELRILTGMYRRLVGLFDLILDEHLEMFCSQYPYVVERVSLLLLDLTVVVATSLPSVMCPPKMAAGQVPASPERASSSEAVAPTTPTVGTFSDSARSPRLPLSPRSPARTGNKLPDTFSISDILWYSLEVLRNVSPNVLEHTGHLVGKGISSFVLSCCSTGAVDHFALENWCVLFHIFSVTATSCPGIGRQYVWDALCHLVDNHHVNTMNFTPCRHLLLKYLHNVFPVGGEDVARLALSHSIAPVGTANGGDNVHLVQAMVRVTKLAMMSLAGFNEDKLGSGGRGQGGEDAAALSTFPCPVLSMAYHSSVLSSGTRSADAASECANYYKFIALFVGNEEFYPDIGGGGGGSSDRALMQPHVQIRAVRFGRADEVEVLWVETAKLLADIVLLLRADVSEQALYALQALFIAGRAVSPLNWATVLNEMTSRLPLNLNMFGVQAPPGARAGDASSHPGQDMQTLAEYKANDSLRSQMVSVALHGCSVIFEAIIEHFDRLMGSHSDLFVSIWAKFIVLLTTNSAALRLIPGDQHASTISELFEMTGNLLRLFSKTVKSAKLSGATSKSDLDHMNRVLTHTWTSCVTMHPAVVGGLQEAYPSLVKELLPLCPPALLEKVTSAAPPTPPSFKSSRPSPSPSPSPSPPPAPSTAAVEAPSIAPNASEMAAPTPAPVETVPSLSLLASVAPEVVVPVIPSMDSTDAAVAAMPAPSLSAAPVLKPVPTPARALARPALTSAPGASSGTAEPRTVPAAETDNDGDALLSPSSATASAFSTDISPQISTPPDISVPADSVAQGNMAPAVESINSLVRAASPVADLSAAASVNVMATPTKSPSTSTAVHAGPTVTLRTPSTPTAGAMTAASAPVTPAGASASSMPGTPATPHLKNRMSTYDNKKFMNFRKSFVV